MWKGGSCEVFADWRQGEPNNWDYGEDCAVLGGEGGWNDLKCEPIGGLGWKRLRNESQHSTGSVQKP